MSKSTEPGRPAAPATPSSRLGVALRAPLAAITLLTVVPLPASAQRRIGAPEVAASAPWFPIVGALLGVVVGSAANLVTEGGSPGLGGTVAAVLLMMLTGALHLDGLADSADALGARGGRPERRLEIMRDPATGVYGTAAIVAWFGLIATAIASLPAADQIPAVVVALVLGRTAAVRHARILPPARIGGLGAGFNVSTAGTAIAVFIAAALLVAIGVQESVVRVDGFDFSFVLPMVIVGVAVSALVTRASLRLIGGRTGDTLGATVALVEATTLVAAALLA